MNSKIFKFGFYSFAIIIVLYFAFSTLPTFFTDDLTSQVIDRVSLDEYVTVDGIVLREETLLCADTPFDSIKYAVSNGDRVAKNSLYAVCSERPRDFENRIQVEQLQRKIKELETSLGKNTQYDIIKTEENIKSEILSLLNSSDTLDFRSCFAKSSDVQIAFNRRQIKFSGDTALKQVLSDLKLDLQEYSSSSASDEFSLYSTMAGYFYSGFDGYEYLSHSDYIDLTVSDVKALIDKKPSQMPENYVGKMQNEPLWKFYSLMNAEYAATLTVGKAVQLEFEIDFVGSKKINAVVDYISKSEDGKAAVTFSCNTMFSDLFSLRKENCKMILNTYSGFKVDNAAVRVRDGETGVYVLSGQRIIFKPVTVVYSDENVSIIQTASNSGSRVLMSKDTVVIGGKDLFDGKVVNVEN